MGKLAEHNGLRTWIEVDRGAIKHNFKIFKSLISPKVKLMAVVKSNAYGHGIVDFAREMEKLGADFLGVDSITEALALRRERLSLPILVLGHTLSDWFEEAVKQNISLTISSFEALSSLNKFCGSQASTELKIHIKVDTGMHRQGFLKKDLPKVLSELKNKNFKSIIKIEGIYTHFANAKNPSFLADTKKQLAEFSEWTSAFKNAGFNPLAHTSATAGTMLFPESHLDMVRIGIGLYGLWPALEVKGYLKERITLKPALVWKSLITEVKQLAKGNRVGYDLTERLYRDSVIGIVPVGYWHGYSRSLSSIGRVIVNKKECKVLGRVSMDMLIVDLTDAKKVKVGDEVIILDNKEGSIASAESLGSASDSSWYEIITRLNPLIKRIYT